MHHSAPSRLVRLVLVPAAAVVVACAAPAPRAERSPGTAASVESRAVASLDPAPAPGSDQDKADLAVVLWLQRTRTRGDVLRAREHQHIRLQTFAPALGDRFDVPAHARTQNLLRHVLEKSYGPVGEAKRRWARPRPYTRDERVAPAAEREDSFSYPSGHATRGVLAARVLGELAPDRRAELLEIGLQLGYDRVVGGVHYPADVLAGQRLGGALADALLATPDVAAELEAVRASEWPGREREAAASRSRRAPLTHVRDRNEGGPSPAAGRGAEE